MRSDILVSVGVVDEEGPAATLPRLATLVAGLGTAFRYFEVIYVVQESRRGQLDALAAQIASLPNLRMIVTSDGTRFYRRRLIAALEAIGDVIAVADLDELSVEHLCRRLGEAKDINEVMIGWRPSRPASGWTYRLLSIASRNIISAQTARTVILPRELLNDIALRRSATLDLRFRPRVQFVRYRHFNVEGIRRRGPHALLGSRAELLLEILMCGVPRFLKAYAATGFLVMIGSLLYACYAVAVLLLRSHVQEGWFSSTIVQAGSTAFIAGGMSMLSIALTAIYEHQQGGDDRVIVGEFANTSFFDKVTDRNVELTGTPQAAPVPHFA